MNEIINKRRSLLRKNIAYRKALENQAEEVKEELSRGSTKLMLAGGVLLAGVVVYKAFKFFVEGEHEHAFDSSSDSQKSLIAKEVAKQTKSSFGKRVGKATMLLLLEQAQKKLSVLGAQDTIPNENKDELEEPTA